MPDTTTISCRENTKEVLEQEKGEDETWDHLLLRLAGEADTQQPEGLARLEELVQQMPERTADEVERRVRR